MAPAWGIATPVAARREPPAPGAIRPGDMQLVQGELNRLLWIRSRDAWEAIKAADLAVRDGNVPLVLLLRTLNLPGELRRIPATVWDRLQMLAEKSAGTLLVFTPEAQIGCARLLLSVGGAFSLRQALGRKAILPVDQDNPLALLDRGMKQPVKQEATA